MRGLRLGCLLVSIFVLGCPAMSSRPPAAVVVAPVFEDEAAVIGADASVASVQSALGDLALDTGKRPSLRYTALRRLEEAKAPGVVALSEKLASSRESLVRDNALALLLRTGTPEAKAAIERSRKSSVEAAIVLARLERRAR